VVTWTQEHDVPIHELAYGTTGSVGPLAWTVLGPDPGLVASDGSDEAINDGSVVLSVRTRGVSLLLTGDVETSAQQSLLAWGPEVLRSDVLKVPHHGSADQDPEFLRTVGARLAVVSVGAHNDYGHPAPETLDLLTDQGAVVERTDESGDIAVVVDGGELGVVTR
jgi:competence protein ComEC